MTEKIIDFFSRKMEEESFVTIFLLLFGAFLISTGTTDNITILGNKIIIKDEFRIIILLMGFLFIVTGIISAFIRVKARQKIAGLDNELSNIQEKLRIQERIISDLQGVKEKLLQTEGSLQILKDKLKDKCDIPPLHTFHGLKPKLRCQPVFQNFRIDRSGETNRNAVYYMWADTYVKNTIHASIESNNNDGFFLHVKFNNNNDQDRWFSNISIHPILEQAINNQSDKESELIYRFLKIAARVQKSDSEDLEKISVIVRICDKNLTYWEYATVPGQFKQLPIEVGDWQHKSVDLSSNIQWQKFKSDGNRENPSNVPDFSVISGVTLVFGGYNNRGQTPMPGKGIIDIHEVYLDNNP